MKLARTLVLAVIAGGLAATTAVAQQKNPVKATSKSVATGKAVFAQNCAMCHGAEGKGDGPAATALMPKPANLADTEWKHGGTDADIFKTISSGVPGTGMVGWASIPEKDRWHLVNYIKSLAPKK